MSLARPLSDECLLTTSMGLYDSKGTSVPRSKKGHLRSLPQTDQHPSDIAADEAVNRFRMHLRAALDASGEKRAVIAAAIGVTESYLSRMLSLNGEQKPISLRHLVLLPSSVQIALVASIAEEIGAVNTVEFRARLSHSMIFSLAGALGALDGHKGRR
jgi:hypothetical protein